MITLLASIAGFMSSIFPEIFKFLHDRSDKKQELAIMQMQMQMQQLSGDQKLQEIGAQSDAAVSMALYQTYKTGITWVDALNGTVRPVITYAFFILYATVKYMQYTIIGDHAPMFQYLDAMWTEEDQAIFAACITFYFGQRGMKAYRGNK